VPTQEPSELNEKRWRDWVEKGKQLEAAKVRRMRTYGGVILGLLAIATGIYVLAQ
jgi:hypothetical protein